ncbi:hypothetical protein GGS20DRAFT_549704 [Poronia punctata]|nr:hypothetical protein GGS20DRAFT_549704 [Poronia punctata]
MPLFGHRHHHSTAATTTMAPRRHHHHTTHTTTTRRHRGGGGGLFSRSQPATHHHRTAPVTQHHKRHATLGDKVSGALLRIKGTLTNRPGQKAAGARRMHGTDGRGSHRHGAMMSSRRKYRY